MSELGSDFPFVMNISSTLATDVQRRNHLIDLAVLLNVIINQYKLSDTFSANALSLLELCVFEQSIVDDFSEVIDPVKDANDVSEQSVGVETIDELFDLVTESD